jgi:hypothetical protein
MLNDRLPYNVPIPVTYGTSARIANATDRRREYLMAMGTKSVQANRPRADEPNESIQIVNVLTQKVFYHHNGFDTDNTRKSYDMMRYANDAGADDFNISESLVKYDPNELNHEYTETYIEPVGGEGILVYCISRGTHRNVMGTRDGVTAREAIVRQAGDRLDYLSDIFPSLSNQHSVRLPVSIQVYDGHNVLTPKRMGFDARAYEDTARALCATTGINDVLDDVPIKAANGYPVCSQRFSRTYDRPVSV